MNKIKDFRKILGMSLYTVAEKTKLSPAYISNLENGHRTNPSKDTMEKISKALEQPIQKVFYPKEA